jgi:hypothetical protein
MDVGRDIASRMSEEYPEGIAIGSTAGSSRWSSRQSEPTGKGARPQLFQCHCLGAPTSRSNKTGNVRYWHKADMPSCTAHVRFWGGVKRTYHFALQISANDPKRTSLDHLPSRWGHDHNRDKLRSVSCTGVLKLFQGTSITTESR